jgi:hypothetical protein
LSSHVVALLVFTSMCVGALAGMLLRHRLPGHHLTKATEDVVRLATGVVATMAALVIGLLLASAKTSFDTTDAELKEFSADVILLDRQLANYGAETKDARDLLRRYLAIKIDDIWPAEASPGAPRDPDVWRLVEDVQTKIRKLAPADDAQRWLKDRALQVSSDISHTRWLLRTRSHTSLPTPFVLILVFWLGIIFTSFGLFAPANGTVAVALLACALSLSASLYLIVEMNQPFGGKIKVSSASVREALALLGQ